MFDEAKQLIAHLSASLPSVVDSASISTRAKIPFKLLCFREALIWRTEELARNALEAFDSGDIAAAVMLTRGVTESAAAAWYLKELMDRHIAKALGDELDETAMKLLLGQRDGAPDFPAAVNIMTMINRLDKQIPGVRSGYDSLSEYAHPNWRGTAGLFSKSEPTKILTYFGRNIRQVDYHEVLGLGLLVPSLRLFKHAYHRVTELMPAFVAACEAQVADKPAADPQTS